MPSLAPGARIGAYEVAAAIGAGGMGEVYRARDMKLGREVALKTLPDAFASDPERVARFRREAHVLASLNHPNIAHIYGLEETADGGLALVMELVDGATLSEVIDGAVDLAPSGSEARQAAGVGPRGKSRNRGLDTDDALAIARQIADALEAAHEQHIVHRDLKPANVKVRPDGTVKVLDFGLAKAMEPAGAAAVDIANSPTITSPAMTQQGVILGTAAYMSPEQARGKPVDKRTDIWAFGCVLYEMVTGKAAFRGEDVTETLAAVVKEQPDLSSAPPNVQRLLRKCLEKDPKRRLHDIGDAWDLLENDTVSAPSARSPSRSARVLAGAGLVLAGVAVSWPLWTIVGRDDAAAPAVSRFVEPLPPGRTLPVGTDDASRRSAVAISPDGRTIAYSAAEGGEFRVYRRFLDEREAVPIGEPGAERPFFSADGQWIVYCIRGTAAGTGGSSTLKRVPVRGGPAEVVAAGVCHSHVGATSYADGTILVGGGGGGAAVGGQLRRVPLAGGDATMLLSRRTDGRAIQDPQLLPGGRSVLYTLTRPGTSDGEVVVHDLAANTSKKLVDGLAGRYLPTGHLTFVRQQNLWAVHFNLDVLEPRGAPVPVIEGIRVEGYTPVAQLAIADSGTLAYLSGRASRERTLVWVDREKREEAVGIEARQYQAPRVSPDGRLIALPMSAANQPLWIWDVTRKAARQMTSESTSFLAAWFPDSTRLAFASPEGIQWKAADGSGPPQRLSTRGIPLSFSTKEDLLCGFPSTRDVGLRTARDGGDCRPLLDSAATERNATISPDDRWLAFESDRTQRGEIYVRPFPDVKDAEWTITTEGGCCPVWSRDGRELYYWRENGDTISIIAVALKPGPAFDWDRRHTEVVRGPYVKPSTDTNYDVWGGRFLLLKSTAPPPPNQIVVVQHWFEELKRLVPVN